METSRRIFVIEDSADLRSLLQQLFESEGYAVEVAENGAEALNQLRQTSVLPNVILLDLMMPVMDGFEFRRLQELDPRLSEIPVVLMTAYEDPQSTQEVSANAYVQKPVDMDVLLETVKRNCASKEPGPQMKPG